MASELQCDHDADANIYFIVRRASDGRVWNGVSFVDYETADYEDYAIAATEQGVQSGFYVADMPSVAEGLYSVVAKDRAGMSPAETDRTVGVGTMVWSGTAVLGGNTGSAIRSAVGLASANLDTQLSGIATNVTTLLSRVTATLFSGITSLADWLRRMARKDAGTSGMATAQTEINAGGSPTFSGTTDSLEGIRDSIGAGGGVITAGDIEAIADAVELRFHGGRITVTSPVSATGDVVTIVPGASYDANTLRLIWKNEAGSWPSPGGTLAGATVTLVFESDGPDVVSGIVGEILVASGANQQVAFDLSEDQTKNLSRGTWRYSIWASKPSPDPFTWLLASGDFDVRHVPMLP